MARRPIPKNRASLKGGDWFPYVLSKIAPLEWWNYCDFPANLHPEYFPEQFEYKSALNRALCSPVFSFSFFRPRPDAYMTIVDMLESYRGAAYWWMSDANIAAYKRKPRFRGIIPITSEEVRQEWEKEKEELLTPDQNFVQRCVEDIPTLCSYLEAQLDLEDAAPVDFSEAWLTKEGLASSRGEFEDFLDRGTHLPYLAQDPDECLGNFEPNSANTLQLHICVSSPSVETHTGPSSAEIRPAIGVSECPLLLDFPPPWDDGRYQPEQIPALLAELRHVQNYAKDPKLLRSLDNFIRVANWANKLKLGIYLSGQ